MMRCASTVCFEMRKMKLLFVVDGRVVFGNVIVAVVIARRVAAFVLPAGNYSKYWSAKVREIGSVHFYARIGDS